jgi:hypothetical protein
MNDISRKTAIKRMLAGIGVVGSAGLMGSKCPPQICCELPPDKYGLVIPTIDDVAVKATLLLFGSSSNGSITVPSSVDLTNHPALPVPGSQGSFPTCVGWACGYGLATFETNQVSGVRSDSPFARASAQDLFSKSKAMRGSGACHRGLLPYIAMDILISKRITTESSLPYSGGCTARSSGSEFGLVGYKTIPGDDTQAIKKQLADGHPVAIAAKTHYDLPRWTGSGIYSPTSGIDPSGNNMMLAVGYDDSRGAWLVQNSWGSGFGFGGRYWMSYQTFSETVVAAYVGQNASLPAPSNEPPALSEFTSQVYQTMSSGRYLLVHPFTFNQPLFIESFVAFNSLGERSGQIPVHQYSHSDYVWFDWGLVAPVQGTYSVEFTVRDQSGRTTKITGQAQLTNGGYVRGSAQNADMTDSSKRKAASLPPPPDKKTRYVIANGTVTTLHQF